MKQRDIGFRELLERVLPLEELPPADRWRVRYALSGGVTREIENAALSTLERLAEGGALRRLPAPPNGGESVMRFQPRDALEGIRPVVVHSGRHARVHHLSEARDDSLAIGRNQVNAAGQVKCRQRRQPAPPAGRRSGRSRRRLLRCLFRDSKDRGHGRSSQ